MHVNDINIDVKYTHKKHAINLLIQLVKEFNIDMMKENTSGKGQEPKCQSIYTKNIVDVQRNTPLCCCLGRNFKLTRKQLIKYSKLKQQISSIKDKKQCELYARNNWWRGCYNCNT